MRTNYKVVTVNSRYTFTVDFTSVEADTMVKVTCEVGTYVGHTFEMFARHLALSLSTGVFLSGAAFRWTDTTGHVTERPLAFRSSEIREVIQREDTSIVDAMRATLNEAGWCFDPTDEEMIRWQYDRLVNEGANS